MKGGYFTSEARVPETAGVTIQVSPERVAGISSPWLNTPVEAAEAGSSRRAEMPAGTVALRLKVAAFFQAMRNEPRGVGIFHRRR